VKPESLLFAKTHEWASIADEGGARVATIGISAFAVEALTDLVFMQLPTVGQQVAPEQPFCEVESVKAVSDVYAPVAGEVVAVNAELPNKLEVLGSDPYGEGWIAKIKLAPGAKTDHLLSHVQYEKQCAEEGH
jgi:glycine cleavage system H protein